MSDFGTLKRIKTRKPHQCLFCLRTIPTKTAAYNYSGMWEGYWQNNYSCEVCQTNDDITSEQSDGICGDEFNDWAFEQEWAVCPVCKKHYGGIGFEWSEDEKTLVFTCQTCGETWEHFIGFEAKEVTVHD